MVPTPPEAPTTNTFLGDEVEVRLPVETTAAHPVNPAYGIDAAST